MWYFGSNINSNPERNSENAVCLLQAVLALSDPRIAVDLSPGCLL